MGGLEIKFGRDFTSRELKLAIDKDKLTDAQKAALERLKDYAKDNGVKLDPVDFK